MFFGMIKWKVLFIIPLSCFLIFPFGTQKNNSITDNMIQTLTQSMVSKDISQTDKSSIIQDDNLKIILKKGDSGTKITDLQKRLDVTGCNLPLTGIYGESTFDAVMDFQQKNGLYPLGNVDENTYKEILKIKLLNLGPGKLKATKDDIKNIDSKEIFANKNGYASYTEYFIWVNKASFSVNVFKGSMKKWKIVKEFSCTIGKGGIYETPVGIFQTGLKGSSFQVNNVSAKYYTQIKGDVLFHTILFDWNGKKIIDSRMKMRLSHGCIRLEIPNAIFIYKNIPQGTTVYIN